MAKVYWFRMPSPRPGGRPSSALGNHSAQPRDGAEPPAKRSFRADVEGCSRPGWFGHIVRPSLIADVRFFEWNEIPSISPPL